VVFEAIKEKPNPNAPNSSWSFKYETQVQDVQGKLVFASSSRYLVI
jgi:hypothetical protein